MGELVQPARVGARVPTCPNCETIVSNQIFKPGTIGTIYITLLCSSTTDTIASGLDT